MTVYLLEYGKRSLRYGDPNVNRCFIIFPFFSAPLPGVLSISRVLRCIDIDRNAHHALIGRAARRNAFIRVVAGSSLSVGVTKNDQDFTDTKVGKLITTYYLIA